MRKYDVRNRYLRKLVELVFGAVSTQQFCFRMQVVTFCLDKRTQGSWENFRRVNESISDLMLGESSRRSRNLVS